MTAPGAPQPIAPERFDLEGAAGRTIRGELRLVPGATATVVQVHGFKGFSHFAFIPYLADRLTAAGISVVSFNFSGSGIGEDLESFTDAEAFEENSYTRELHDLGIVLAHAGREGWLGAHHGLWGHSRGGGIAILRAARDTHISALATWAAISTVKRWPYDLADEWRARGYLEVPNARTKQTFRLRTRVLDEATEHGDGMLDVGAAAETLLCPWLIVHGDADETVHVAEGEELAKRAGNNAELLTIEGATHTFNVAHGMTSPSPELTQVIERTVRFFAERLALPSR
ncbi:MAG TPA: alpha/beta hydrolase [Gemmatimonadaceae bacterium]|jgi:dipeptidyl aminopeptidase/acylaminoacyl peptidase|nr:alpha/beta hydrolase [Gemmatimonadaceae bacterium]